MLDASDAKLPLQTNPSVTDQSRPSRAEWLALLCILLASHLVVFGPALVGTTVLYPLDLLALKNFYLPGTSEYATVIPQNRHLTDSVLTFGAQRKITAEEYAAGRIPLWNNKNFLGAPNVSPTKYSPFEVPLIFCRSPIGVAWQQLVQGFIAGIGCFVFLRQIIKLHCLPSTLAATCYPWTGFYVLWQGHPLPHAACLLPWLLIGTYGTVTKPTGWSGLGLAALTTSATFACPDIAGQALLVSGIFAVCLWTRQFLDRLPIRSVLISIAVTSLSWGLGLAACSVFIFPFMDYVKTGQRMQARYQGIEERPPVGITALPLLLLPDSYGTAKHNDVQITNGNQFESGSSAFAGILVTLFLVPLAFYAVSHRYWVLFFSFVALLGMSWQLNLPIFVHVLRLPMLNMMSHNRFVFATGFALIVLAGIGGDAYLAGKVRFRAWNVIPIGIGIAFAIWCLFRAHYYPNYLYQRIALGLISPPASNDVSLAIRLFQLVHVRGFALTVAALLCWTLITRSETTRRYFFYLFMLAGLAELIVFARGENRQAEPRLYFPKIPALVAINNLPPGRVMGIGCLPPSLNHWHGLSDVRGYDAVDPKVVIDLFDIGCDPRTKSPSYARTQWAIPKTIVGPDRRKKMSPIWDMLNVRYFITRSQPPRDFPVIVHNDDYWVIENTHALSRVFIPTKVSILQDESSVLREMSVSQFNPQIEAFSIDSSIPKFQDRIEGSAMIVSEDSQQVEIAAKMKTPGIVVLADMWDPGWVATVDGEAAPIYQVNHCLRGVCVLAGDHQISMTYDPPKFREGLRISLIAFGSMAMWLVWLVLLSFTAPRKSRITLLSKRIDL